MGTKKKSRPVSLRELFHKVSIREDTGSEDIDGYDTVNFTEIANGDPYAKIKAKRGQERWDGDTRLARTDYEIVIRYRTDLTSDMQIHATLDGVARVFKIEGFFNVEEERKDTYLGLICLELPSG